MSKKDGSLQAIVGKIACAGMLYRKAKFLIITRDW